MQKQIWENPWSDDSIVLDPSSDQYNFGSIFNYNEIIGLSYLASIKRKVMKVGLTQMMSFDGRHRSGKSVAASTIGWLFDPTFRKYYEHRLIQEPTEFMDALENIAKQKIYGGYIQVDEAGVSMGSSDWYESWMKALTKTMQVFGYLHPMVSFTSPIKDFVDSRVRKMFHCYFSVARTSSDYSMITPYESVYNTVKGKYYYRKPVVRFYGQKVKLNRLILSTPPEFILDRYQEYEKGVKPKMVASFMEDIKNKEKMKQDNTPPDLEKIVQFVLDNKPLYELGFSRPLKPRFDADKILRSFKIKNQDARYVKREAERKAIMLAEQTEEAQKRQGDQPAEAESSANINEHTNYSPDAFITPSSA